MYKIEIMGPIPSKKNSRVTVRSTGRSFPSAKYQQWHRPAMLNVIAQGAVPDQPLSRVRIKVDLRFPTLQRADLTNKAESVMDLLVDAKVIEDDSWLAVGRLVLTGCLDRENPGATVTITEDGE